MVVRYQHVFVMIRNFETLEKNSLRIQTFDDIVSLRENHYYEKKN